MWGWMVVVVMSGIVGVGERVVSWMTEDGIFELNVGRRIAQVSCRSSIPIKFNWRQGQRRVKGQSGSIIISQLPKEVGLTGSK